MKKEDLVKKIEEILITNNPDGDAWIELEECADQLYDLIQEEKRELIKKIKEYNEKRAEAWEKDIVYKGKPVGVDRSFRAGALSGHRWCNDYLDSLTTNPQLNMEEEK